MDTRPVTASATKRTQPKEGPGSFTLERAREQLRAVVQAASQSIESSTPPLPKVGGFREATWAVLDRAVERCRETGRPNGAREEGDYDFSGLTDQELAREMLAEFPELLVEARRVLELGPEQPRPRG